MAATDELSAPDDQTILFRLKRLFPLLPDALGKCGSTMCPIMPERLALTDPFTQGRRWSAPARSAFWLASVGRLPRGVRAVRPLRPVPTGTPDWTSGPKLANLDLVE